MSNVSSMLRKNAGTAKSRLGPGPTKNQESGATSHVPTRTLVTSGSTTDEETARSGYESEVESVSDSQDSEDDDLLSVLAGSKAESTVRKMTTKRSAFFETGPNSSYKKLKLPPVEKVPFLRNNTVVSVLNKSKELQKQHMEDKEAAIEELKKKKDPEVTILRQLDPKAAQDKEYVDYLTTNKDIHDLEDFYFFRKTPFVPPENPDPLPLELYLIPGIIRRGKGRGEFDVFNEVEPDIVDAESVLIENDNVEVGDIKKFMRNIGGDYNVINKKNYCITKDSLKVDPKWTLQSVELILKKFEFFINKLVKSSYSEEKYELTIMYLGFVMMDKRVYDVGDSLLISGMLNNVLVWGFKNDSSRKIPSSLNYVLQIWFKQTDELRFIVRIIETLQAETSIVIANLRRLIALNVFLVEGEYGYGYEDDLDFLKGGKDLNEVIYKKIVSNLQEWNKKGKKHLQDGNFLQAKIKFLCLFQCLEYTTQSENEVELANVRHEIEQLRSKVSTSFHSAEQAFFKSLLLLIATVLERKRHTEEEFIMS